MPFRSMLEPSHTANAMGHRGSRLELGIVRIAGLNERFTTTRQVGPVYPPP